MARKRLFISFAGIVVAGCLPFAVHAQSAIVPYFVHAAGTGDSAEVKAEAIKFAKPDAPGEVALNKFVDDAVHKTIDFAKNKGSSSNYFSEMSVTVNYLSSYFISVSTSGSYFVGQPHPEPWSYTMNIDRKSGHAFQFADMVNGDGANKIFSYCREVVRKKKAGNSGNGGDDVTLEDVSKATGDLSKWIFEEKSATVVYSLYDFGGYGQCNCSCEVPYKVLGPLVKPGFLLPNKYK
jgi:hypothetical protein